MTDRLIYPLGARVIVDYPTSRYHGKAGVIVIHPRLRALAVQLDSGEKPILFAHSALKPE